MMQRASQVGGGRHRGTDRRLDGGSARSPATRRRRGGGSGGGGGGVTAKPSLRYQLIRDSAPLEEHIQAAYAPRRAQDATISRRRLSLRDIAKRDGERFRPPSLSSLCIECIGSHFATHILPGLAIMQQQQQQQPPPRQRARHSDGRRRRGDRFGGSRADKRRRVSRGFGASYSDEEEEDASRDWVPSGDEASASSSSSSSSSSEEPLASVVDRRRRARPRHSAGSLAASALVGATRQDLEAIHEWNHNVLLKELPPSLRLRIFHALLRLAPESLSSHVLTTYFCKGQMPDLELSASIPCLAGASNVAAAILAGYLPRPPAGGGGALNADALRSLHLVGLTRLADRSLAPFLRKWGSGLHEVVLKGCAQIADDSVRALYEPTTAATATAMTGTPAAARLRKVDLSFTDVGWRAVAELLGSTPLLQVLKLNHVQGLDHNNTPKLLRIATDRAASSASPFLALSQLRTLGLASTRTGEAEVALWLRLCRNTLEVLDVRNTALVASESSVAALATSLGLVPPEMLLASGEVGAGNDRGSTSASRRARPQQPTCRQVAHHLAELATREPSRYFGEIDARRAPLRKLKHSLGSTGTAGSGGGIGGGGVGGGGGIEGGGGLGSITAGGTLPTSLRPARVVSATSEDVDDEALLGLLALLLLPSRRTRLEQLRLPAQRRGGVEPLLATWGRAATYRDEYECPLRLRKLHVEVLGMLGGGSGAGVGVGASGASSTSLVREAQVLAPLLCVSRHCGESLEELAVRDASGSGAKLSLGSDVVEELCSVWSQHDVAVDEPASVGALSTSSPTSSWLAPTGPEAWDGVGRVRRLVLRGLQFRGPGGEGHVEWRWLMARGRVEEVDLAATNVTEESVDELLSNEPLLHALDLTGCRGIPVRDRRNYFEAYEARRRTGS